MNRGPDWPVAGPHPAVVLLLSLLVAACQPAPAGAGLEPEACELAHTPISSVQGDGAVSPLVGQAVTVSGVVTLTEAGGYYLEQPEADAFPQTSNALYIERATTEPAVISGQWRVVRGVVAERGDAADSLTALTAVSSSQDCGRRAGIPVTEASLPLDASQREALEAMNLQFSQALVLSNARDLSRGDVVLSLDTMLPVPTEIARPGADARAQAEMNRRRSLAVRLAEEDREPVPAGSQVLSLRGVLGHDQQGLRLLADDSAHLQAPALYRVDPPESGAIRVLALNLHNYFNGDGQGQGFPTPRGAETRTGFAAQRSRLSAQVGALAPDLVAVMELENDGFGPHSAAADFSRDLEAATGAAWRVVQPWDGPIGDDQITVGLFYRADRLQPQGPAEVLDGPDFANLSRQPVAQVFADPASGEAFLVVVNHLKSKGSCPQQSGCRHEHMGPVAGRRAGCRPRPGGGRHERLPHGRPDYDDHRGRPAGLDRAGRATPQLQLHLLGRGRHPGLRVCLAAAAAVCAGRAHCQPQLALAARAGAARALGGRLRS